MGNIIIFDKPLKQPLEDYIKHDLPLLVKEKPRNLSWQDHNCVIVGFDETKKSQSIRSDSAFRSVPFGPEFERKVVADHLIALGFKAYAEELSPWIRSDYLTFDDFIVSSTSLDFRELTRAGAYVFGKDFILVSDSLVRNYVYGWGVASRRTIDEKTVRKFWEIFGIEKVYFLPPSRKAPNVSFCPPDLWNESVADLDFTVNSIPWLDLYTVDEDHYKEQRNLFRRIERENGIEFIVLPASYIKEPTLKYVGNGRSDKIIDLWANNYFVLTKSSEGERETHVFYNNLTPAVEDYLKKVMRNRREGSRFNIQFHDTLVPIVSNIMFEGSLHCFTNTAPSLEMYQEFRKIKFRYQLERQT